MQLMREWAELDKAILEVCMVSSLTYSQVLKYVEIRCIETGYSAIDIARGLREKASMGADVTSIVTS